MNPDVVMLNDIGESFVPTASAAVASVEIDGEAVLFDGATWALRLLDPMATILWSCFDGSATIEELVSDLSDVFRADALEVRRDVMSLVGQLLHGGFLVAPTTGPGGSSQHGHNRSPTALPTAGTDEEAEEPRFVERGASV